jgi:hypothetical protein
VSEAINKAVSSVIPKSATFPHWLSDILKYYIIKKLKKYKKSNSSYYYNIFSYDRKLVKTTIKADRLARLKKNYWWEFDDPAKEISEINF